MTEERITETTRDPATGSTHTHTTVVNDGERSSSGGSRWGLIIVLLVLVIGAIFVFSQMSDAEVAKDEAISEAANDVGNAAGQIGDAAQDAADSISD
ncbi:hypothetical protein [Erythrobacter alti]|uniref:hypothetical protein n=1 Tax=Erythrobacter alti TaxID=1896145 RepID=UPI0030F47239